MFASVLAALFVVERGWTHVFLMIEPNARVFIGQHFYERLRHERSCTRVLARVDSARKTVTHECSLRMPNPNKTAAATPEEAAQIAEALAAPVEVRIKPAIVKMDPSKIPGMAARGLRPVPSQPKRRAT